MDEQQPIIHDRGRGPEIRGTRITVYDVMDYHLDGHHHTYIASLFRISSDQVIAAIEYIEAHRDELMPEYQAMLDRDAQGNPPHIRAMLEESHKRVLERLEEIRRREAESRGGADAKAAG